MRKATIAKLAAAGLLTCAMAAAAQAVADLGFTTRAGPALVAQYTRKFGNGVADRVANWTANAREQKASSFARRLDAAKGREADLLQDVNYAINRHIRGITDQEHWGVVDYWATPAESIGSAGGDCEDYSLAKYYLLKELGVPIARLRITYVRILNQGGAAHMVLAYYASPDAEPLILDNIDAYVRTGSDRRDLDPVYGFNDDEVQLVKTGQRGKPAQIRAWLELQERLVAESGT